jgi:hypothetical protein
VDNATIKKADANYHILVNVINQKLVGDDVTEFSPIPHVLPANFTDVYGDCFISGFIEGGVFDATISMMKKDENSEKGFEGKIAGGIDISGVGKAEAEISGEKKDLKTGKDYNTAIT